MAEIKLSENQIKNLFKIALTEVLEERRDLFREVVEEALEDLGLAHAIEEGLKSKNVSRKAMIH
jgi:hypothetical protein